MFIGGCDNFLEKKKLMIEKRGITWEQKEGGIQITHGGWALEEIHVAKDADNLADVIVGTQMQFGLTTPRA